MAKRLVSTWMKTNLARRAFSNVVNRILGIRDCGLDLVVIFILCVCALVIASVRVADVLRCAGGEWHTGR